MVRRGRRNVMLSPAEDLPPGWMKEIHPRPYSNKSDTYYFEPVTERKFRSRKSVDEYLEAKAKYNGAEGGHSQSVSENNEADTPISVDDYPVDSVMILLDTPEGAGTQAPLDKISETPAAGTSSEMPGTSSEMPPDDFFDIPWLKTML